MSSPTELSRQPNLTYRSREYLTPREVQRLLEAAGQRGRHPLRDRTLLLLMFRHGLRVGEACLLKWDAVMLEERCIAITRLKGSNSGVHRLQPDELEALVLLRERYSGSYALFVNERGARLTTGAIAKIMKRSGELADLPLPVHPHMLRHSCGYYLAEQGLPTRDIQEYLGHKNIQHTVRYTAANPARFDRIVWM
ncbi:tyrosine-type recombinase/integrase [Trichocoleus sp. FACHB-262]|uniref:tyrosine-type recombinase/integrase n=1 Tax=Trichocoleus sp. FACHB-262 TaxID=2692869 RepID=UPI001682095C|nr:tyrosine-type recombinase/integrase [Trichocoleus sp. FACHB-262]MBD2121368.1 tyrosine-type recombinase/integrase [Trichocoleus sp. FACHB-262]